MPTWLKSHLPTVAMFIIAMFVGLETLEVKFEYQEQKADEQYSLLREIQKETKENAGRLIAVTSDYRGLEVRLSKIETIVPSKINDLEKELWLVRQQLTNSKE